MTNNMTNKDKLNVGGHLIKRATGMFMPPFNNQSPTPPPAPAGPNAAVGSMGSGGPGMFMPPPAAPPSPQAAPPPDAPDYAGMKGDGLISDPQGQVPQAPTTDFEAEFQKYHGSAFDPNSRRDRNLMAQLQNTAPNLSPESVYTAQYGAYPQNKTASMKHTDKLKIGLYCNELTEKQAMELLKRLGTGALNLGKGIGQGAMSAGKEIAALPMKGLKNFGNEGARDILTTTKGSIPGHRAMATGQAIGLGGTIGGAAVAPVMGANAMLDRSKNKGLEQGKSEGMSAALAGVQKSKQDRGYIGTLLDALMNR